MHSLAALPARIVMMQTFTKLCASSDFDVLFYALPSHMGHRLLMHGIHMECVIVNPSNLLSMIISWIKLPNTEELSNVY